MKNLRYFAFLIITLLSLQAYSQCNEYYPLRDGLEWTYESYNTKGKLQSTQHQKVTAFASTNNGFNATVEMDIKDEKGKDITKGELEMKCNDGVFYFDMRKFIPEEQLKAMGDMEIQVEADNLEYPNGLSVGKSLKDGSITLTTIGGAIPMKIKVDIIDRKVEAMESITTPAGTFETYKITSKSIMKNQMGITMTFEYNNIEWLAKEVGVVKSESFRKGKSQGYTLLVKRN